MQAYYSQKLSADHLRRCYEIAPLRVKRYLEAEIEFVLDKRSSIELAVFDPRGRLIAVLEKGPHGPGRYATSWDGRDSDGHIVSTGVYFYRLRADGGELTKKMVFVK